jgi:hypothetical protein
LWVGLCWLFSRRSDWWKSRDNRFLHVIRQTLTRLVIYKIMCIEVLYITQLIIYVFYKLMNLIFYENNGFTYSKDCVCVCLAVKHTRGT